MGRMFLFILIGAIVVGLWARSAFAEKKKAERARRDEPSELNKHPERLEQNLDPTDDA